MGGFITRGPKEGKCNICGSYGKLTEDHTPPKGSVKISQVLVNTLTEILELDESSSTHRHSQNGLKFRSLCKECNNNILGGNYDVALNQFSHNVKSLLNSGLQLPSILTVKGVPSKIARAIYGHLCAVGVDQYFDSDRNRIMRDWFYDEQCTTPDFFNIYYWPYPFQKQILIRNAILKDLRFEENAIIWLMKYFPIAFLIVWYNPKDYQYPNLGNFSKLIDLKKEIEIPIRLTNIPEEHWPETPSKTTIFAFDRNLAVGAVVSKNKKQKNKIANSW
jgi:hypothetical protein